VAFGVPFPMADKLGNSHDYSFARAYER